MNSPFTPPPTRPRYSALVFARSAPRRWARGLAGALLLAGLAGCGHTPEAATAGAAPAAPPLTTAPAAPVPAATPAPAAEATAPVAAPSQETVKAKPVKALRAPQPVAEEAPAAAVAEEAPAAPEPVAAPAAPATRTQAGRVLDENGRPLVGATVMLRGSTKGTSTDASGSYSLEVPSGDNTFVVGYGGYEDETASSHDGQPLNVTLLPTPGGKGKGRRSRR